MRACFLFSVYCRNQFLQDFAKVWRFEEQQPVWMTFPRWKIESHTMPTSGVVDRSVTPADKNENLRLSSVMLANSTGVAGNRRYEWLDSGFVPHAKERGLLVVTLLLGDTSGSCTPGSHSSVDLKRRSRAEGYPWCAVSKLLRIASSICLKRRRRVGKSFCYHMLNEARISSFIYLRRRKIAGRSHCCPVSLV